jgi:hypothetical protein
MNSYFSFVVLACVLVIVLVIGPKFAGSNPAEDNGVLKVIKSLARLTSGGGGSKAVGFLS